MKDLKKKMIACQGSYLQMAKALNKMAEECQKEHGCKDLTTCPYALAMEAIGNLAEAAESCHVFYSKRFESESEYESEPEPEPEPKPRRGRRRDYRERKASDVVPELVEDDFDDELDDDYLADLHDEDI